MNKFLVLLCLCLLGCSNANNKQHYYKTDRQYRLEEQIDELYEENEKLQYEVYEFNDRAVDKEYDGENAMKYYDEYDDMESYDLQYEADTRQNQIYDNELEIIDLEYELDMTYY